MTNAILISVRLHDDRFHGLGELIPSPARLFQALIAGAGIGGPISRDVVEALLWLENLDQFPTVAAPFMHAGQAYTNFVPDNLSDAMDGDFRSIAKFRTAKEIKPRIFHREVPFLYMWPFAANHNDLRKASLICSLAERLYQFGRGVDLAWAWGEVLDSGEADERLMDYPGVIYRPSDSGIGVELACPESGSLNSLQLRHRTKGQGLVAVRQGRGVKQLFSQPARPRFTQVAYNCPPKRHVLELREPSKDKFFAWPLKSVVRLVETIRDKAYARLRNAIPNQEQEFQRFLIGRKADGSDAGPTELRVRIIPLPSIGFHHVDHEIRRVLVEVPSGCPLRSDDVRWAFSGVEVTNDLENNATHSGVINLVPTTDTSMLKHYGIDEPAARIWRTVTPIALPHSAMRRRIEPSRKSHEAKAGDELASEHCAAASAIIQALRHAGIRTRADSIRVQREPFESNGKCVEAFATGTRFAKEALWHAEIAFSAPLAGPLAIGSGRFLGLGLMSPLQHCNGVLAFEITDGLAEVVDPLRLASAFRRAVMSCVNETLGTNGRMPAYFTGHERDGSVARSEDSPHLSFAFDPRGRRLLAIAPHLVDHRQPTQDELRNWQVLLDSLSAFSILRAGASGLLRVQPVAVILESDPLFAKAHRWSSVTPYHVNRHAKGIGAAAALIVDLANDCQRRGLPVPKVTPLEVMGESAVGLSGRTSLNFAVAVSGPIILGKNRFLGGGLFVADPDRNT